MKFVKILTSSDHIEENSRIGGQEGIFICENRWQMWAFPETLFIAKLERTSCRISGTLWKKLGFSKFCEFHLKWCIPVGEASFFIHSVCMWAPSELQEIPGFQTLNFQKFLITMSY